MKTATQKAFQSASTEGGGGRLRLEDDEPSVSPAPLVNFCSSFKRQLQYESQENPTWPP